jgi:sigma-B regulation protein RsbU (phosphoserine phosphatase)
MTLSGASYSQTGVRLDVGDMLVLYTDGTTEAIDSSNNELGLTGLLELARTLKAQSPVDVIRALISGVRTFRGNASRRDDDTLLVLRRVGVG